jgi:hypothetical protein
MGEQQQTTIASAFSLGSGDSKRLIYFKPRFATGNSMPLYFSRLSLAVVSYPALYKDLADSLLNLRSIKRGSGRSWVGVPQSRGGVGL